MLLNPNRAVVEAVFRAFAAGEIAEVEGLLLHACADNVTIYEPQDGPFAGTYEGLEAFRNLMQRIHRVVDMSKVEVQRILAEDDDVVVRLRVTDAFQDNDSGQEGLACEWYRFLDGWIVEIRPFTWLGRLSP